MRRSIRADIHLTRTPTISERLADHVVGLRYEDIPDAVIEKAKHHLGHLLGAAFRGRELESGQRAVCLARELSGAVGDCSIVGEHGKVDLLDAAFANSALITGSGLDDFLLPHGAHPGIAAQPVAWAFGETTRASGRDLLTAVVIGYDVLVKLCDPTLTWGLDVYRPATFVLEPFGAAATAARLLGLSHEQTVHAFGHAGQVGRHRTGAGDDALLVHALVARNSGMAAMLAKAGMAASPTVIEGEDGVFRTFFSREVPESVEAGLATLGHEFAIAEAQIKAPQLDDLGVIARHPAVIPVELTRRLMDAHALSADRVAAVNVALADERRVRETMRDEAVLRQSADRTTRRSSLRFRIAMVVADGGLDPARFERPLAADLLAVLNKVRLRYEPARPLLYTRVEVTTTDGDQYSVTDDGSDADVPPSIDWADWLAEGGRASVTDRQLTRLVQLIRHLEDVPDVAEVMACVVP